MATLQSSVQFLSPLSEFSEELNNNMTRSASDYNHDSNSNSHNNSHEPVATPAQQSKTQVQHISADGRLDDTAITKDDSPKQQRQKANNSAASSSSVNSNTDLSNGRFTMINPAEDDGGAATTEPSLTPTIGASSSMSLSHRHASSSRVEHSPPHASQQQHSYHGGPSPGVLTSQSMENELASSQLSDILAMLNREGYTLIEYLKRIQQSMSGPFNNHESLELNGTSKSDDAMNNISLVTSPTNNQSALSPFAISAVVKPEIHSSSQERPQSATVEADHLHPVSYHSNPSSQNSKLTRANPALRPSDGPRVVSSTYPLSTHPSSTSMLSPSSVDVVRGATLSASSSLSTFQALPPVHTGPVSADLFSNLVPAQQDVLLERLNSQELLDLLWDITSKRLPDGASESAPDPLNIAVSLAQHSNAPDAVRRALIEKALSISRERLAPPETGITTCCSPSDLLTLIDLQRQLAPRSHSHHQCSQPSMLAAQLLQQHTMAEAQRRKHVTSSTRLAVPISSDHHSISDSINSASIRSLNDWKSILWNFIEVPQPQSANLALLDPTGPVPGPFNDDSMRGRPFPIQSGDNTMATDCSSMATNLEATTEQQPQHHPSLYPSALPPHLLSYYGLGRSNQRPNDMDDRNHHNVSYATHSPTPQDTTDDLVVNVLSSLGYLSSMKKTSPRISSASSSSSFSSSSSSSSYQSPLSVSSPPSSSDLSTLMNTILTTTGHGTHSSTYRNFQQQQATHFSQSCSSRQPQQPDSCFSLSSHHEHKNVVDLLSFILLGDDAKGSRDQSIVPAPPPLSEQQAALAASLAGMSVSLSQMSGETKSPFDTSELMRSLREDGRYMFDAQMRVHLVPHPREDKLSGDGERNNGGYLKRGTTEYSCTYPGVSWNTRMQSWLVYFEDTKGRKSRTFNPKRISLGQLELLPYEIRSKHETDPVEVAMHCACVYAARVRWEGRVRKLLGFQGPRSQNRMVRDTHRHSMMVGLNQASSAPKPASSSTGSAIREHQLIRIGDAGGCQHSTQRGSNVYPLNSSPVAPLGISNNPMSDTEENLHRNSIKRSTVESSTDGRHSGVSEAPVPTQPYFEHRQPPPLHYRTSPQLPSSLPTSSSSSSSLTISSVKHNLRDRNPQCGITAIPTTCSQSTSNTSQAHQVQHQVESGHQRATRYATDDPILETAESVSSVALGYSTSVPPEAVQSLTDLFASQSGQANNSLPGQPSCVGGSQFYPSALATVLAPDSEMAVPGNRNTSGNALDSLHQLASSFLSIHPYHDPLLSSQSLLSMYQTLDESMREVPVLLSDGTVTVSSVENHSTGLNGAVKKELADTEEAIKQLIAAAGLGSQTTENLSSPKADHHEGHHTGASTLPAPRSRCSESMSSGSNKRSRASFETTQIQDLHIGQTSDNNNHDCPSVPLQSKHAGLSIAESHSFQTARPRRRKPSSSSGYRSSTEWLRNSPNEPTSSGGNNSRIGGSDGSEEKDQQQRARLLTGMEWKDESDDNEATESQDDDDDVNDPDYPDPRCRRSVRSNRTGPYSGAGKLHERDT